jgi:trehalose 6-phosphate phosphatase
LPEDYGDFRRARQAIWAAASSSSTANSRLSVDSGVAVIPIAASEVAVALRISPTSRSCGTIRFPPAPKNALKNPATRPDREQPHEPAYPTEVAATANALLERLAAEPRLAALFLDFDGVLAPIVARPEDAEAPLEARAELGRLAARYAFVAVVSGRAGDDVRSRVGVAGIRYVGSHGLELDPEAERWREPLAAFAAAADWPAAEIEPKGLGVTFHYRGRADEDEAVRDLEALAGKARARGLAARFGRKILEVLPPLEANKGTAVRTLLAETGVRRALAAGDDVTDIDSFRALDGLELAVRVAVASPESPAALRESADVVVPDTGAFLELLRSL